MEDKKKGKRKDKKNDVILYNNWVKSIGFDCCVSCIPRLISSTGILRDKRYKKLQYFDVSDLYYVVPQFLKHLCKK